MRKITGNQRGLFSRSTAGALVLLLVVAGWPPTAAAWKIRLDWSKVQAVKPGTRTTVFLYKDQAPRGSRKIKGLFHSATEDFLTLQLKDGQTHTLQKSAVRKVLVRRPFLKRYQVWATAVVSSAVIGLFLQRAAHDFDAQGILTLAGMFILTPTFIAFAVAPQMGGIYNVPPKYRAQPSADKPSGAKSKASGNSASP